MATRAESRLNLRAMTAADLPAARALSKAEQWPHRVEDWEFMLKLGQGVVVECDGRLAGTTMWWPSGADMATLGMVIVDPAFRGMGIAKQMMEAALAALEGRSVMLNATEEGLALYQKFGFVETGAILQQQGTSFTAPIVALEPGERVRPAGASDGEAFGSLVRQATGLDRPVLMRELLDGAHALVLDRDGVQTGYALFRRFGRGSAIGPVVAPHIERAKALISTWLGSEAGMFIRLDIPEDCGLSDWLEDLGIVRVGRVITMVRGTPPQPEGACRSFAIVSQALG